MNLLKKLIGNPEEKLKKSLVKNNTFGLALDVDDTIGQTVEYLMEKFHKHLGYSDSVSIEDLVKKHGKYHTPFWKSPVVENWMIANAVEFHSEVPLIENAHALVQKINTIIPIVAYITAREEKYQGLTEKWLKKHNFPDAPVLCHPGPDFVSVASMWKADLLERLYPNVVGIVDDNERLVRKIKPTYKGTVYLYDSSDPIRKDIDVIPCKTWDNVYEEVKKRYGKN